MKTLSIFSLVMALFFFSFTETGEPITEATTTGIQFQNINFQSALNKAKKENKFIFMNVYATWCGPCMLLKKTTFQSDRVAAVVNKSFINIDIDAEKGEGIQLSKRYNVRAHPLVLIIDSNGNVVKSILGYKKDNQLLAELQGFTK